MRSIAFLVVGVCLAGAVTPSFAGEVYSYFHQTGIIAPLERGVYGVELVSADITIRLPRPWRPSAPSTNPAHIRARYELRNRQEQGAPLLIAFPMIGGGPDSKVHLKIDGKPAAWGFYEPAYLAIQLKKSNIQRWMKGHPEVGERISQVPSRETAPKAFQTGRDDIEAWLDREMGLSQHDAHSLVELMLPGGPPWSIVDRVSTRTPWPHPLLAPYGSLTHAINLRWRNEGLFLNPDTGRLTEYHDDVGAPGDTSLVEFRHTIPPNAKATVLVDYDISMGSDNVTKSEQLQFVIAQANRWRHGYRVRDEVKVQIEVPRGWRKVRIRPAMDLVRTTSRSRIYRASFTRPREDIYIALVP